MLTDLQLAAAFSEQVYHCGSREQTLHKNNNNALNKKVFGIASVARTSPIFGLTSHSLHRDDADVLKGVSSAQWLTASLVKSLPDRKVNQVKSDIIVMSYKNYKRSYR